MLQASTSKMYAVGKKLTNANGTATTISAWTATE